MALQAAQQKSRGLRSDLQASIQAAEEALQACLVGTGMSPKLAKAALEKLMAEERKHRAEHIRKSGIDLGPRWQPGCYRLLTSLCGPSCCAAEDLLSGKLPE